MLHQQQIVSRMNEQQPDENEVSIYVVCQIEHLLQGAQSCAWRRHVNSWYTFS
jgi:hypothetical protein